METRICENCMRVVPLYAYKEHLEVCKKYVSREEALWRETRGYDNRKALKKRVKSKGRKCLVCGRDPSPNYFYCPAHMPDDPYYEY